MRLIGLPPKRGMAAKLSVDACSDLKSVADVEFVVADMALQAAGRAVNEQQQLRLRKLGRQSARLEGAKPPDPVLVRRIAVKPRHSRPHRQDSFRIAPVSARLSHSATPRSTRRPMRSLPARQRAPLWLGCPARLGMRRYSKALHSPRSGAERRTLPFVRGSAFDARILDDCLSVRRRSPTQARLPCRPVWLVRCTDRWVARVSARREPARRAA